jgi:hypothetical protein
MNRPLNERSLIDAGYVRRSSEMQKDNYSIDAQKRAITDAYRLMGRPAPRLLRRR